jgi:hypothetical protein
MESKTEGVIMQEISKAAGPRTTISPKLLIKVAWFIRACGLIVLAISVAGIMHEGWPPSPRPSGSLMGLVQASMLFVMSFIYTTSGRTKLIIAGVTIVLAVWAMAFSLAMLGLPHL